MKSIEVKRQPYVLTSTNDSCKTNRLTMHLRLEDCSANFSLCKRKGGRWKSERVLPKRKQLDNVLGRAPHDIFVVVVEKLLIRIERSLYSEYVKEMSLLGFFYKRCFVFTSQLTWFHPLASLEKKGTPFQVVISAYYIQKRSLCKNLIVWLSINTIFHLNKVVFQML